MTRRKLLIGAISVAACIFIIVRVRDLMMLGFVDSAISRIRAVTIAEGEFNKAHPDVGYACTFSQLHPDGELARLEKDGRDNGYFFNIIGCQSPEFKKPNLNYEVTARPLHSGLSVFCSDQSGVIKYDKAGSIQKCLVNGVPLS